MDRCARAIVMALVIVFILPWVVGCQRSKPRRPSSTSALATLAAAIPTPSPSPTLAPSPEEARSLTPVPLEIATPPPLPSVMPTSSPTLSPTSSPTLSPTVLSPTPLPTGDITYVVREGDTLASLARAYQTTVWAIMSKNGLSDPDRIRVGQALIIPVGDVSFRRLHRVRPGESLASIARLYGVSMADLAQANGLSNPNRIVVGQVLVIPR